MLGIKDVLKGSLTYSAVPIFTALITLFVIPVVSYIYPADEYGKINLFYSLGLIGMSLFLAGFDHAFMRFFFEKEPGYSPRILFTAAFVVGLSMDVILGFIILALFPIPASLAIFGEQDSLTLLMLFLYIGCLIVFRLLNTMARMSGNRWRFNIQSILQNIITRALFVAAAWYSTSYKIAALVMTGGMLLVTIFFVLRQRKDCFVPFNELNAKRMGALAVFGFPCMLDSLAVTLNSSIGKLVLGNFGYFGEVGVLAIATTLATSFSMIPQAFGTYWAPFMYEHYEDEKELIKDVHDYIMMLALVIVTAIILFQDILFLLVGGEYRIGQSFFMLLMLAPIQSLICETTNYGIMIRNKPIYGTVITTVGIGICAVITILLAQFAGAFATGVGVACSALFVGVARSAVGYKLLPTMRNWMRTAACSALIVGLCIANCFVYQDFLIRTFMCFLFLVLGLMVYRDRASALYRKIISKFGHSTD